MNVQAGDILLYRKLGKLWPFELAVDVAEMLEDGPQLRTYFHVAVAISEKSKIEALPNVGVVVSDVTEQDANRMDLFRPPVDETAKAAGIQRLLALRGQPYDKWLIADDLLRSLSVNKVHLPTSWLTVSESHEKICSTLAAIYLTAAGCASFSPTRLPTPEDIYLAVMKWPVKTGA